MNRHALWLIVLFAMLFGATFALAQGPVLPAPSASVSQSQSASKNAGAVASASAWTSPLATTLTSPLPSGSAVPLTWMPPQTDEMDGGPSQTIFPKQSMPLRFSHKKHDAMGLQCVSCHTSAKTSVASTDVLIPTNHDQCIKCHSIDETKPFVDDTPPARCDTCHLSLKMEGSKVTVAKMDIPSPNLFMNHKAHAKEACSTCHGDVAKLDLASRDQLPRMRTCTTSCHNAHPDSECIVCHLTERDGTLKREFADGALMPPAWMSRANHDEHWIQRHARVAGSDSTLCQSCHTERDCAQCHDGTQRPRDVHPNDWLTLHPLSARLNEMKCTSCHSQSTFCVTCHQRAGVALSSPPGAGSFGRFHPDAAVWSGTTVGPMHHSSEAKRNMMACVSCHVERDCVSCHASGEVGGAGVNPHDAGFQNSCKRPFKMNPRPCLVCHESNTQVLQACE